MEKISVIVPCYEVGPYIDRFFKIMFSQIFKNFKLLFVYDRSKDDTLKKIKENIDLYSTSLSCELLYSPVKKGLGAARDFALDSGAVKGLYFITLDPDDIAHPDFFEKLIEKAEKDDADITFCGFRRVDVETNKVIAVDMVHNPDQIEISPENLQVLVYSNPSTWNKLIRRSILGDCRYIHAGGSGEDAMFYAKLIPLCKKASFVNEVLIDYSIRKDSFSAGVSLHSFHEGMRGFIEVKEYYRSHKDVYRNFYSFLDAIVVLRVGIGLTTRCSLNNRKQKKIICKETRQFLNNEFPKWKKCRYLSFLQSIRFGKKALLVWMAKMMIQINLFPFFINSYRIFLKLFKKDIKW